MSRFRAFFKNFLDFEEFTVVKLLVVAIGGFFFIQFVVSPFVGVFAMTLEEYSNPGLCEIHYLNESHHGLDRAHLSLLAHAHHAHHILGHA